MTITQTAQGARSGLITPIRSTAKSDAATQVTNMLEKLRRHLLDSFSVRSAAEGTLAELEQVRIEAGKALQNVLGKIERSQFVIRNLETCGIDIAILDCSDR